MSKAKNNKRTFTKVCAECGKTFEAKWERIIYCSRKCYRHANHTQLCRRRTAKRTADREAVARVCPVCGKKFTAKNGNAVYCSLRCRSIKGNATRRAETARRAAERVPKTYHKVCPVCGVAFEARSAKRVYCSSRCTQLAWRAANPGMVRAQRDAQNAHAREKRRESAAVRAEVARLAAAKEAEEREARRKERWAKVMAEIRTPIGDDEPLRRYVG